MRVLAISLSAAIGLSGCVPPQTGAVTDPQKAPGLEESAGSFDEAASATRPKLRPSALSGDVAAPQEIENAEAEISNAGPGLIGRSVGSLGNAAEPGLWVKTPLVDRRQAGRVTAADTGRGADVTLIPLDGPQSAGSQLSLATMQALGVPLTSLPVVEISRR